MSKHCKEQVHCFPLAIEASDRDKRKEGRHREREMNEINVAGEIGLSAEDALLMQVPYWHHWLQL